MREPNQKVKPRTATRLGNLTITIVEKAGSPTGSIQIYVLDARDTQMLNVNEDLIALLTDQERAQIEALLARLRTTLTSELI